MPCLLEPLRGTNADVDARIGALKILEGHRPPPHARIIEAGPVPLEAFQHHKMIELPMDDAWEIIVRPDTGGVTGKALGLAAQTAGSQYDVLGIAAVPRHAAFLTQLFQGHPKPVVS